ncbi:MAG: alpha/beta hydrolase [Planctomycetota bacterium]|jgi:esterase/lipase superfamily enzyme
MHRLRHAAFLLIVFCLLGGCQRELIPTPNLYLEPDRYPFTDVTSPLRTNTVDVLYATDRLPSGGEEDQVEYGYERSDSVAFGSLVVEIGRDISWDELVEASRTEKRKVSLPLKVVSITEQGWFPETPPPITFEDDVAHESPEYLAEERKATDALHDELRRRLALTPRKEAFVFIHGYNNTIEVAAFRMAELWHFLGREGVPVLYSWPAGSPGLIRSYTYDRESSEFTIYHLKEFLKALAACPELEVIHIIAHSRGCDVAATALRELIMVAGAGGDDPQEELKIGHVVLAAPDLDYDVAQQRFGAERLYEGWELMTIYVTKKDRALGTAEWLFSSRRRIGKLRPEHYDEAERERSGRIRNIAVVDARVRTDYLGHAYFLGNPATFSDIILVLRYGRAPGAENGRPLTEVAPNYYILNDDYPQKAAPLPKAATKHAEAQ